MFWAGPWNSERASGPKSIAPRYRLELLSRVHTRYSVEPGWYSHRSTALPRSERNVNVGSLNWKLSDGTAASGWIVIVFGDPGLTATDPMSWPYVNFLSPRGAANSLY